MIAKERAQFNSNFTEEKYQNFLQSFENEFGEKIGFRVSETPVFIEKTLREKIFDACDGILNQLQAIDFEKVAQKYLPENLKTPKRSKKPHFIAIDFGMCESENGEIEPQLIELQAFPSLFAYQVELGKQYLSHYDINENNYFYFLNNFKENEYVETMKRVLLGNENAENVILLEIFPEKQKTNVDFWATEKYFEIPTVCLTKIIKEGNKIFYHDKNGNKIQIKRIYNRVIFDELNQIENLQTQFNVTDNVEVEWITHPDWFFIISKAILPLLKHKNVPKSYYVNDFPATENLENYVLKPLFSFAGKGVNLNPTQDDLEKIEEKHNFILQKKVVYQPVVLSPEGKKSKVEIRILYVWENDEPKPTPVINLARMSKGEMINVSHNTNDNWIGGSIAFFEK